MADRASRRRLPPAPLGRAADRLPPTALTILTAAKEIVAQEGFDALTLDAIARAAHVNKAATHYHFGNKAGLIEAIVDEIVLDECAFMAHDVSPEASLDERLDSLIDGVRRMAVNPSSFGGWFDIFPHAVRTEVLRARLVALYRVWFRWNLEWAGLGHVEDDVDDDDLRAMGQLIAAVVDGIAVQATIGGEAYDPEPILKTFRHCLRVVLEGKLCTASAGHDAHQEAAAPLPKRWEVGERS